jgi:hypothetical protein
LTPVDLDVTLSFVTPSVKKKERAKRHLMENNEEVVYIGCKKNKRSESQQAACKKVIPAAKLIVVYTPDEAINDIRDICSQVDLPKTGKVSPTE